MVEEKEAETIRIGLTLQGEMARRFATIKKHWGFETNTDVLRMLITREYEKIVERRE
jgi:hypothetical protein